MKKRGKYEERLCEKTTLGQIRTDGDTSGYCRIKISSVCLEGKTVCRGDKIRTGLWKVSNARLATLDFISTIFCCSNKLGKAWRSIFTYPSIQQGIMS